MLNDYTIYKHIFPNNKIYIGITKRKPETRWNKGKGYNSCPLMSKAIKKYGCIFNAPALFYSLL